MNYPCPIKDTDPCLIRVRPMAEHRIPPSGTGRAAFTLKYHNHIEEYTVEMHRIHPGEIDNFGE